MFGSRKLPARGAPQIELAGVKGPDDLARRSGRAAWPLDGPAEGGALHGPAHPSRRHEARVAALDLIDGATASTSAPSCSPATPRPRGRLAAERRGARRRQGAPADRRLRRLARRPFDWSAARSRRRGRKFVPALKSVVRGRPTCATTARCCSSTRERFWAGGRNLAGEYFEATASAAACPGTTSASTCAARSSSGPRAVRDDWNYAAHCRRSRLVSPRDDSRRRRGRRSPS